MLVKVVLTHPDAQLPKYAKPGDAGADVFAAPNPKPSSEEDVRAAIRSHHWFDEKLKVVTTQACPKDYFLWPGDTVLIDLGFRIQLEPGWEIQVRSRSGLAKRGLVVANAPGTIDSGYRGPCMVLLRNNSKVNRVVKPGTRVAQFVLKRAPQAEFVEVDELSDSERGKGGFGSTGTN